MANLPEHPKKLAHVLHSLAHALSVHKRFLRSSGICPGNPIDFADRMRGFQLDPQGEHSKKRPSRYLAVPWKKAMLQSLKHSRYSNGVRALAWCPGWQQHSKASLNQGTCTTMAKRRLQAMDGKLIVQWCMHTQSLPSSMHGYIRIWFKRGPLLRLRAHEPLRCHE